ncbi:MAG: hypothetical protein R8G66_19605 [Cytophagales bacterium]|nr:hypothetical protein [Cytophagales bacterium]
MSFTFLPANLDLQEIVRACPPSFDGFDIDKLTYLLGLIESIPLKPKNEKKDGYTLLNAQLMKNVVNNYKSYLNYACNDAEIIEIYTPYRPKYFSKGYRFREPYTAPIRKVNYQSISGPKKLKEITEQKLKTVAKHWYLYESLQSEGLDFNYDLAVQTNEISHQLKSIHSPDIDYIKTVTEKEIKHKSPKNQYNQGVISLEKIKNREWDLFLDSEGSGRFYHTLCSLPSKFRHLLSYKDRTLVSLDLKNSQPYLFSRLLQPDFYYIESTIGKSNRVINPHKFPYKPLKSNQVNHYLSDSKSLFELNDSLYNEPIFSTSLTDSYTDNRIKHSSYVITPIITSQPLVSLLYSQLMLLLPLCC